MKRWLTGTALIVAVALSACGGSGTKTPDAGRDVAGNSGGAKATGGSGGSGGAGPGSGGSGTGGASGGSGGRGGGSGGAMATGGAVATGGSGNSGGRGGTPGGTGGAGSGGRGGGSGGAATGGAGGVGGGGRGGGNAGGSSGAGGATPCGPTTCSAGLSCCNASCGLCAPPGVGCIQIACVDAGISGDASACLAIPGQDSQCSGKPPHYYRCVGAELPAPCVVQTVGNLTQSYCCP